MKVPMKKQGRRLGPFQFGRRCKHAAAELGHIHDPSHEGATTGSIRLTVSFSGT